MIVSCILVRYSPKMFETLGRAEKRSIYCKNIFCFINIAGILLACYFFKRHNDYCEPGGVLLTTCKHIDFLKIESGLTLEFSFYSFQCIQYLR